MPRDSGWTEDFSQIGTASLPCATRVQEKPLRAVRAWSVCSVVWAARRGAPKKFVRVCFRHQMQHIENAFNKGFHFRATKTGEHAIDDKCEDKLGEQVARDRTHESDRGARRGED